MEGPLGRLEPQSGAVDGGDLSRPWCVARGRHPGDMPIADGNRSTVIFTGE